MGAIALVASVAWVDSDLCTECGACLEVCPEEAIHIAKPVAVQAATASALAPLAPIDRRRSALGALLGTTLAFVGREVVPRFASTLVDALEQRLMDRPSPTSTASPSPRRGGGRRRRQQGGNGARRGRRA